MRHTKKDKEDPEQVVKEVVNSLDQLKPEDLNKLPHLAAAKNNLDVLRETRPAEPEKKIKEVVNSLDQLSPEDLNKLPHLAAAKKKLDALKETRPAVEGMAWGVGVGYKVSF